MAAAMRTGCLEAEGQHVGHGEFARVAHEFGDDEQSDEPGDEEADRVEESVVAVDGDGAADAEEGCGREVVTGDGEAVLRAGELGAAGVEVAGLLLAAAGDAHHDEHRDDNEGDEDGDVDRRVAQGFEKVHRALDSRSSRSLVAMGSTFLLEWRM